MPAYVDFRRSLVAILLFSGTALTQYEAAFGQEAPLSEPPSEQAVEATESKVNALNAEMKELDKLMALLKDLGDPAKRLPEETAADYLKRVDRVLKARAVVVALVGQQVKRLLIAKYQLAEDLREYEVWAKEVDQQLKVLPDKYRSDVQKLETEYDTVRPEVVVLARLLYEGLPADAKEPKDSDEAADLKAYFSAVNESGHPLLEKISNRAELEGRFSKLTPEQQRQKLEEYIGRMVDIRYEVNLLNNSVIVETEAFRDLLPKSHREVLKAASDLLNTKSMKTLDDKASQVSILARYTGRNLQLVQTQNFRAKLRGLPELGANLVQIDKTMADLAAGKVTVSGRASIMSRMPVSPGEKNQPPQPNPPTPK